jgi:hypothetical protein
MADLNALIAQGYQFQPLPDPFAQYGKMQQLENSAMQNRLAQQQMQENAQFAPLRMQEMQARLNTSNLAYDQAKEAKDVIAKVMNVAAENGGPTDPIEIIKQLSMHSNPLIQAAGKHFADSYQLIQRIEQQQKFNQGETGVAAPAAAPTAAYMPTSAQGTLGGPTPAMLGALGSGTFDVNAPAAAPVAAPAAAAPAAPADKLSQIEARIAYLNKFPDVAQAKLEREELIKLRAELVKPYVVDRNLVTGTGNVIYTAPEKVGYHVVGNSLVDNVGNKIYTGPAKTTIKEINNPDQTTSFVSINDDTNVATPIMQDGKALIGASKPPALHVVGNTLVNDKGVTIYKGPAKTTIKEITNPDQTISFVSINDETNVSTPITQDGKLLTGVSVPSKDLAFRQQKEAFEQSHPTLSIQQVNQPDGSAIVVAVNTKDATYQPVVARGDTFVPAGPAMPISGGMPSVAAPSAASASLAAPFAAAIAPEAAAAPAAAVPNALVGGAVNNAFVSNPTGAGQPLISAAKKAPETKSEFEKMLESLGFSEDEKNKYRLAKLAKDTAPSGQGDSQFEKMMEKSGLSELEKIKLRKQWLAKETKSGGGGGGGQGKPPTGYRWDNSGENLEKIPGGPADKEEKLKPIPPNINTAIGTNDMSIKQIEDALDLLKKYPDAIGLKNLLPGQALDRADPKGVAARSAIGNIGSLVIHDRSGSAVSQSEMQRLGFIPTPTDRADNAKTKLEAMLKWAKMNQQGLSETYSEDQGYKPNPALAGKNKAAPANVSNW